MKSRYLLIAGVGVLVLAGGVLFLVLSKEEPNMEPPLQKVVNPVHEAIGQSVEGRVIERFTYTGGDTHLLFIGGMHGGYEWNSVLLAYRFLDYLEEHFHRLEDRFTITVIPTLNPDGLYEVTETEGWITSVDIPTEPNETGKGRFNAHNVDLNRNFDCKWAPESTWRGAPVSAGTEAFSEPEAKALRDFVLSEKPDAAIFWHSKAGAVYASECEEGILTETLALTHAYADAAGYAAVEMFDAYPITGDAEGWLASIQIPALTVELETRESIEWEQNRKGVEALFDYYKERNE